MSRHIVRCAAVVAFAAIAGALSPPGARAGVRTVVPEQFVATSGNPVEITPPHLRSYGPEAASFWAPLELPAGATVKKLVLYSWGVEVVNRQVMLLRTRLKADYGPADLLMGVSTSELNPPPNPPTVTSETDPAFPESDLVVRPGYRYFLLATSDNFSAYINGVKVHFQ